MKRKLFLTLVLVALFFIGSSNVDALSCKVGESGCTKEAIEKELINDGKELACLYETTVSNDKYYNYIYYDFVKSNNTNYKISGSSAVFKNVYGGGSTLDIKNKNVAFNASLETNTCPKNSYIMRDNHSSDYICFDNEGSCLSYDSNVVSYEKTSSKLILDNISNVTFKGTDSYKDYIGKENFCVYIMPKNASDNSYIVYSLDRKGMLFYQDNGYKKIVLGFDGTKRFSNSNSTETYLMNINDNGSCPSEIYYYKNKTTDHGITTSHYFSTEQKENITFVFSLYEKNFTKPDFGIGDVSCEIFSKELRDIINNVMNYIRIGVPLLLIVLIAVDFGKASFANDEKIIVKSKKNAITRIIIAVIVFFVPTILNLIFNIANDIWSNAHYEICVLNDNNN